MPVMLEIIVSEGYRVLIWVSPAQDSQRGYVYIFVSKEEVLQLLVWLHQTIPLQAFNYGMRVIVAPVLHDQVNCSLLP